MLNICKIYHIYATYMTDEIVSHICTLFGTYIVHTCETIQLSYMPHICDIFHIYLTYMKCSIFYIFNLYVIYGTYMPKCMSYMEHICAAYMRCIYVVYMLAYMQTYMTTYMLHICMFRMGLHTAKFLGPAWPAGRPSTPLLHGHGSGTLKSSIAQKLIHKVLFTS